MYVIQNRQPRQFGVVLPGYHASTPVSEARAPPLVTPMIQRHCSSASSSTSSQQHNAEQRHADSNQHPDTFLQETEASNAPSAYDQNSITQYPDDQYQRYAAPQQEMKEVTTPKSISSHCSSNEAAPYRHNMAAAQSHHMTTVSHQRCGSREEQDRAIRVSHPASAELQERYFQEGCYITLVQ